MGGGGRSAPTSPSQEEPALGERGCPASGPTGSWGDVGWWWRVRGAWPRSELQEAASEDSSALRCGPGAASDRERVVPSQGLAGGGELSSGHSSG